MQFISVTYHIVKVHCNKSLFCYLFFDIIYQYVYGTWLFGNGNNYPLYDKNDYHFVEVYYEDFFK